MAASRLPVCISHLTFMSQVTWINFNLIQSTHQLLLPEGPRQISSAGLHTAVPGSSDLTHIWHTWLGSGGEWPHLCSHESTVFPREPARIGNAHKLIYHHRKIPIYLTISFHATQWNDDINYNNDGSGGAAQHQQQRPNMGKVPRGALHHHGGITVPFTHFKSTVTLTQDPRCHLEGKNQHLCPTGFQMWWVIMMVTC